jgi:hypothetical protein
MFYVTATLMRTEKSWEEQQEALKAAKVLAEFANLNADDANEFRKNNPDFVPQAWWEYRPTDSSGVPLKKLQWEIVQLNLRDAWLREFQMPLLHSMFLLSAVFDPEEMAWSGEQQRPSFATGLDILDIDSYPYHEAIQWLHGQNWRLKTCFYCKKHFVAEHPKRQFCTFGTTVDGVEMSCFWAHRKMKKTEWWSNHKKGVNVRRRLEYQQKKRKSSPRLPGTRQKEVTAKA